MSSPHSHASDYHTGGGRGSHEGHGGSQVHCYEGHTKSTGLYDESCGGSQVHRVKTDGTARKSHGYT